MVCFLCDFWAGGWGYGGGEGGAYIVSWNLNIGVLLGEGLLMNVRRALFYRGLAELKYLGMIKNSRKKTDHLTKLAWKGL